MSEQYERMQAEADKLLQPDGSVVTRSGEIVTAANEAGAKQYEAMMAQADKLLQPDGSTKIRSEIGGGGGGSSENAANVYELTTENASISTPFDIATLKVGDMFFNTSGTKYIRYGDAVLNSGQSIGNYLILKKPATVDLFNPIIVMKTRVYNSQRTTVEMINYSVSNPTTMGSSVGGAYPIDINNELINQSDAQSVSGTKTFNVLPLSTGVPSADNQLVNKKYVDDAIAAAINNL